MISGKKPNVLSVLLAEDEYWARDLVQSYISKRDELSLDAVALDGEEAISLIKNRSFDLIFLDINLPLKNGLEVQKECKPGCMTIFTTGQKEHSLEAFEMGAIDYLVKPILEARFNEAIDRALTYYRGRKSEKNLHDIPFDNIEKNNAFLEVLQKRYNLKTNQAIVCLLILKGKNKDDIYQLLSITSNTLKSYLREIYSKTIEKDITSPSVAKNKLYSLSNFLRKIFEKID